ncbi:hypothetical protein RR46_09341 [Papilio xuthus]|uniref:Cuticular protein n=1 Tax=Papilio xuthus TaxID=66420 RepID=A0A194PXE7_PAPXU|nr:hypothetical protein RR46_09341 [Papilio xuthus]
MMKLVVLSCLLAAASASLLAPLAYSTPYAYPAALAYSAPLVAPYNYRGPLSLAPGQPANILAADGRPLDTLDVNLNRAAHYTAKALDNGFHLLKKRSVITPVIAAPLAHVATPLITPAVRVAYTAPYAASYITPVAYARTATHVTHVL